MKAAKIDPPKAPQTATELLQAEVLRVTADNNELRAKLAAHDSAAAVRNAIIRKRYLILKDCAREAGVPYGTGWAWHNNRELDSFVIPDTSVIMCEVNDLIARRMRTGRHARRSSAKMSRS
jgi:hypothetical protein